VVRLHHVRGIASVSELKKGRAKSRYTSMSLPYHIGNGRIAAC
jgi:hypothetical protein